VGALLARRLGDARAWEVFSEKLLTTLEPDSLGEKLKKSLSSALVGFFSRDPRTLDRAHDLFAAASTRDGVRWAIADATLVIDRMHGSDKAARLRSEPRCPPSVTRLLIAAQPDD
jgi:hypothetical protein